MIQFIKFFIFPEWSYYFIAGSCFYLIYKEGKNPYYFFLIGLTYLLSLYNETMGITNMENHYGCEFNPAIIIILISSFYFIFLMISTHNTRVLNKRIFLAFGALTYPLYLIHQNVGYMLFNYLHGHLNKYFILLFVTIAMLAAAYFIHIAIEKKFSKQLRSILELLKSQLLFLFHKPSI